MAAIDELVQLVRTLRGPEGCPWDRRQDLASMRKFLLEEAHEVVETIDHQDLSGLGEELGDLLFVVTFIAELARERGAFSLDEAIEGLVGKMVERHPHVFAPEEERPTAEEVRRRWEADKARRRAARGASVLDGVPAALPALARAEQLSRKAANIGFDWPDITGVREKVSEELGELDEALDQGDPVHITEEYGDLLFSLVNLGRFLPTDGESALRQANAKFEARFRALERGVLDEGLALESLGIEELERRWQQVKEQA